MNCWIFLIAGYETSSTALAYLSYALCQHPDVQDKLVHEIRAYQKEEAEKTGSEVQKEYSCTPLYRTR